MRLFLLLILPCLACAHTSSPLKGYGTCTAVTSPRDLARVRDGQRQAYRVAAKEAADLSRQVEIYTTVGLNARNASKDPLSVEETLVAQKRLRAVRDSIVTEAARLDGLAIRVPGLETPLETLPDGIAADPQLTAIRERCLGIQSETQSEITASRNRLTTILAGLQKIANDFKLPVKIGVNERAP